MFSIGWSLVTGLIEVLTINQNPAPCIFQSKQIVNGFTGIKFTSYRGKGNQIESTEVIVMDISV